MIHLTPLRTELDEAIHELDAVEEWDYSGMSAATQRFRQARKDLMEAEQAELTRLIHQRQYDQLFGL